MTPIQHLFFDFVQRREDARIAKDLGIHPSSDDPIIAVNSFCNINREHDRVTKWICANVRGVEYKTTTELVFQIAVARVFNNPDALEQIMPCDDVDAAAEILLARQRLKRSVFRGAYMMPSHGSGDQLKESPITYYLRQCQTIYNHDFESCQTLEDAAKTLLKVHGFGPFLVNQVVTDLRYTERFERAPDWHDFIWGGPGTSRGLCRYFGVTVKTSMNQKWIKERLEEVRAASVLKLPESIWTYYNDPNNLSNSFCEFDKYCRVFYAETARLRAYKPQQPTLL